MDTKELKLIVRRCVAGSAIEEFADALNKLDSIRDLERELRAVWKDRLIEHIQEHGPVSIGCKRYWVGNKKVTKVKDKAAALQALLTATSGDCDLIARDLLSSDAFKPGACKTVMTPEQWADVFEVTTKAELKDGKPAKELLDVDERFIGKGRSQGEPEQE